jgi:transcriptional regulator with XRE-family HTH domain
MPGLRQGSRNISAHARELGQRIQAARERKRVTQATLAAELGVTDNAVTQWETGRAIPRAERLAAIAGSLGVLLTWLVTGEGPIAGPVAETFTELQLLTLLRTVPPEKQAAVIEAVTSILQTFGIG